MKKIYLTTLMMLLLLASCGTSENNNVNESNNQENKKVKEKVSEEGVEPKKHSDKEQKISKIQDNVVHGKLTLTDQKNQGAYYDEKNQTKYILGENSTIKKIINKSNGDVSPSEFMQKDAKKVDEYSGGVYRYYSESIGKYYKVINKNQSQNNTLIVTLDN
ncbi:hypothetical protein [Staphylococcus parequorum]|uniref:hypothetical protein n=1 Tax=Staphylococcus sp. S9 TaxID=3135640 RepID=UPI003A82E845